MVGILLSNDPDPVSDEQMVLSEFEMRLEATPANKGTKGRIGWLASRLAASVARNGCARSRMTADLSKGP